MKQIKRVLAVETSCDDTSIAIVEEGGRVRVVASANQDLAHEPFGGVVPEIASRNHTLQILPLVEKVLSESKFTFDDIDGIVVTSRPGLVGSLIVGVVTAKTLALALNKPFIGINHLEGHILAPLLQDEEYKPDSRFNFPFVALVVSGGHTHLYDVTDWGEYRVMGQTIDDAAGEAFDKFAKMAGLGFPGGVAVDRLSKKGNPAAFDFPRPLLKEQNLNFSFSGLKTSALRKLSDLTEKEKFDCLADMSASYQEAIVDVLIHKLDRAADEMGYSAYAISGGVSANSRLRERALQWAQKKGVICQIPPLRYCTDNAAMIGLAGIWRLSAGQSSTQDLGPSARSLPTDFKRPASV